MTDKGFEGEENHRRWLECYEARIIQPPKRNSRKRSWPKRLRRWVAGIRQIVETVYEKLFNTFGLYGERPHEDPLSCSWPRTVECGANGWVAWCSWQSGSAYAEEHTVIPG